MRLLLRLLATCTTRCAVCPIRDIAGLEARTTEATLAALEAARDEGATEVVFLRGEITLRSDLPELIRAARRLGFELVQLQTDARRLAYPAYAAELARAGATHVEGILYGALPAIHDALAQVPGAFEQSLQGLTHAAAAGLSTQVAVPLARPSLTTLAALPAVLASAECTHLQLALPRPIPDAEGRCSVHVPTLAEALVTLATVRPAAAAAGVSLTTEGLPLCALGADAPRAADASPADAHVVIDDLHRRVVGLGGALRASYRPWTPACDPCAVRAACPTTWASWLGLRGDDELQPLATRPADL